MASSENATPRINHSGDKAPETIGANVVCLVIALVGVSLRFLSRRLARAETKIDDWLIVLALVLYIAAAIDGFICIALGAGKHEAQVTDQGTVSAFSKASFAFIILYRPAIALVKFSVIFLYRRIFPQAKFRHILTYYGIVVLIYTVIFLLLDIFHCRPVSQAWNPDHQNCLNIYTIWIVGGSLNAITDIAALFLPLPLLWRLQVTREKRIQLIGIFLLGGFVCIVSIIRVVELAAQKADQDESWGFSTTIIWSTVEVGIGIFCACLPVMRPILNKLAVYVPTMEVNSGTKASSNTFHKTSHATNFRMRSYRNSQRFVDLEDVDPFAKEEPQVVAKVTRADSNDNEIDVEPGYGRQDIAVTTKIQQEIVKSRSPSIT